MPMAMLHSQFRTFRPSPAACCGCYGANCKCVTLGSCPSTHGCLRIRVSGEFRRQSSCPHLRLARVQVKQQQATVSLGLPNICVSRVTGS